MEETLSPISHDAKEGNFYIKGFAWLFFLVFFSNHPLYSINTHFSGKSIDTVHCKVLIQGTGTAFSAFWRNCSAELRNGSLRSSLTPFPLFAVF